MTYPELQAFRKRIPQPSGMTAAQWELVKADIRERSFFMAAVSKAEILDLFKRNQERLIGNQISPQEYRRAIREGLDKLGYRAPTGKDGTIQDLASFQRQNLVMETNRRLAAGYAQYWQQWENRGLYPAKQMVRLTQRREPRDWNTTWKETAATTAAPAGSYNASKKAALIDSPIWREISRFGVPYPIYDYNSGMGDKELTPDESRAFGLEFPDVPPDKPIDSFNESFTMTPRVKDAAVWDALERELRGLSMRVGDKLIYTDPNGTRRVYAEDLPKTIATPNSQGIPLEQAKALRAYFTGKAYNEFYFDRLIDRVIPEPKKITAGPVATGLRFGSENQRTEFLARLQARDSGGWDGEKGYPSATRDVTQAIRNSNRNGVVLVVNNYKAVKDLGPARDTVFRYGDDKPKPMPEVFWSPLTLFVVNNILERQEGPMIVTLEEQEAKND